jgi:DNA repair protein RadC
MIRDLLAHERPRERLAQYGPGVLTQAELLAILMRTGVQGENVISVAQRLLTGFGGLAGLTRASLKELARVKGIGPAKATELQAAFELGRRIAALPAESRPVINNPADAARLVMGDMGLLDREELRVLLLNVRNHVLKTERLYQGNAHSAAVRVAEVFQPAIRENATAMLLVHNHPSGDLAPSPQDVRLTQEIVQAGGLLGIDVLDHLIVSSHGFLSLKEKGLGFSR